MAATGAGAIKTVTPKATAMKKTTRHYLTTNNQRPINRRATMSEKPIAMARLTKAARKRKNSIVSFDIAG